MRLILPLAIVVFFWSCDYFGPPDIQHSKAEITDIGHHSDTSVLITIEVLKNSNAYRCWFDLCKDTIPIVRFLPSPGKLQVISQDCNLEKNYEIIVGGLKKEVTYYFQMHTRGSFHIEGQNYSALLIGKQWEYTIQ